MLCFVLCSVVLCSSVVLRVCVSFVCTHVCSATGILVGVVVAWTMGLQQVLFTQLPIPFTFPWLVTAVIFGLSLVLAVLSSLGPVNRILRLPVVQILRLLN